MRVFKLFLVLIFVLSSVSISVGKEIMIDLDDIVVTSSRLAQNDYKLSSDVTVIDQEAIEASSAKTVSQLLFEQVGINIYDNSTIKTAVIDIRGFGDTASRNVLVLVNDRRINPVDISGPDLLQIPLDSVKRIEIIRGASTVLYGDNAVGGVVNIITKEGHGKLSGKVGGTYGSYDTRGGHTEIFGSTHNISYYAYSQYDDHHGYRQNSDILSKDFNSRLSTQISDRLKISLDTTWHQDEYGLPNGLTIAQINQFSRRATVTPSDKAFTKDRALQATFDFKPWPQDIEFGHFVLDTSFRDRDTFGVFYTGGEFGTKRAANTLGLTGKYIFDQTVFDRQVNLITGIDYYKTDQEILGSGFSTDNLTISKEEIGTYISSEFEIWNHLFVTGGDRYETAYYTFDQNNFGAPAYIKQSPSKNAAMVGSKYEYSKGSNIFFNIEQIFRFLATDEWYDTFTGLNTNLEQQNGIQYELGIKHNFEDKITAHLTSYMTKLRNEIFFDPGAGGGFGSNSNYDRTLRKGFELGQTTDVLKFFHPNYVNKLEFFSGYTYQDAEFDAGAYNGNRIPMVPKHETNVGIKVGFLNRYETSLMGRYVGSRFAINDTNNITSPIKPYYTVDGKIAYNKDPFEVYFAVNNIFDGKYYSYVSKSTSSTNKVYYPAAERNFTAGVDVKF